MSAPPCTTEGCDGFTPDNSFICSRCCRKLERWLGDVPALIAELEVTATRQAVIGSGDGGRKSAEKPLPFHWNASDDVYAARNTLTTWVRILQDESGYELFGPQRAGPTCWRCTHQTCWDIRRHGAVDDAVLCLWLIRQIGWFRHRRDATEFYDEISHQVDSITRAIDRAAPMLFAGACPTCKINLYARMGATDAHCRECGGTVDVTARRTQMLESAEGMLFNTTQICQAVASWGQSVTPHRIAVWKDRRLITSHGVDVNGRPTYRLSDILDKLFADEIRRREKEGAA